MHVGLARSLLVTAIIGGVAALSVSASAQDARKHTLVVAVATTPASIDGEEAPTAEGEMMMANIHGGDLFAFKVKDNAEYHVREVDLKSVGDAGVEGRFAESWSMEDGGKTYTIHLKHGIKSPFGNEFTAADYRWSWARRFAMKSVGEFMADGPRHRRPRQHRGGRPLHRARASARPKPDLLQGARARTTTAAPSTRPRRRSTPPPTILGPRSGCAPIPTVSAPTRSSKLTPGSETILTANPNWSGAPLYFTRIILKAVPNSSSRLRC